MKHQWPSGIREPAYSAEAPRQTVSLTINSDLFARIKALGLNASRIAEEALARELENQRRAHILAEVESDLRAVDEYARTHGHHGELVRQHYEKTKSDEGDS